jgi:alkyl sulfatase BDS1-like metallo-beta-lactamase superfamily hydrolase
MNLHLKPTELVDFVKLPRVLTEDPDIQQTYGALSNHIRGVYSGLAGWFDGEAASFHLPPENFEAA